MNPTGGRTSAAGSWQRRREWLASVAGVALLIALFVLLWPRRSRPGADSAVRELAADGEPTVRALARLQPVGDTRVSGTVVLEQTGAEGEVRIRYQVRNLPPGHHGLHLHRVGDCSAADLSSAGPALTAPDSGGETAESAPPGRWDLAVLRVGLSGRAQGALADGRISLAPGARRVAGRSLLIDLTSEPPPGGPRSVCGRPLACGVIELAPARARNDLRGPTATEGGEPG